MNLGKETETLEFKKTTGEMKEAMVSISSMLNKYGIGTLYFGVRAVVMLLDRMSQSHH